MTNMEKYRQAFREALETDESLLEDSLAFDSIPEWDSVGHMRLISLLEDAFGIIFEPSDIMSFRSFGGGREILAKYGIELQGAGAR